MRSIVSSTSLRLAVVLAALLLGTSAHGAERPNVILILCDDMGWGDLGCYGNPKFKTPRIDRMAAEGVRFTQFYSCYAYCAPSRASLQTGRYPLRSGMTHNPAPDEPANNNRGLPPDEITLGKQFHSAGYATMCIGKWHLGHQPQFYPRRQGYDHYYGILYSNDMRPVKLWEDDEVVEYPVVQATLTRRYTERSLKFIESHKDSPFFLYLPHAMPHKPLAASEGYYEKSGAGLYGDVMAEVDWSIGEILDKLKELDLEKRTLVLFTSDNGPWYGGSTGGLRGMKGRMWEGGVREPMIARWPGHIPAGRVCNEPAVMMDLFTTSLTAAGIATPSDRPIDGKDIMPLMTSDAKSPHEAIFFFSGDNLSAMRSGKWKLHLVPAGKERPMRPDEKWIDPRRPDGVRVLAPYEQAHPSEYPGLLTGDEFKDMGLFDLDADPAEQHNVAGDHPDVVRKLRALADDCRRRMKR